MTDDRQITVLLAGFGGPEALDEVPAFVESVLGRTPPEHVIPEVVERYRAIGGGSPLPTTSRRQAQLLEKELGERGRRAKVHVGMLHARPTIVEAADQIAAEGAGEVLAVSLAPYRCEVSSDAYERAVADALEGRVDDVRYAPDWNLDDRYLDALADMLGSTIRDAPEGTPVIFAAHSLPQRMVDQGDPYARQLEETARAVADRLELGDWQLAYQSVSAAAREPWLGPSVEEAMDALRETGVTSVVVDPIGFIADHVETLYDNDVEHRAHAGAIGLEFHRCRCLNDHPGLISGLADVVESLI
jgi:ferrochelatase